MARANALQARTSQAADADAARARALAKDFLTLWKDADHDIPILIVAESEYAKLTSLGWRLVPQSRVVFTDDIREEGLPGIGPK